MRKLFGMTFTFSVILFSYIAIVHLAQGVQSRGDDRRTNRPYLAGPMFLPNPSAMKEKRKIYHHKNKKQIKRLKKKIQ